MLYNMSKKARFCDVQRFAATAVTKWQCLLQDKSTSKLFEAIMQPQNSASQLGAIKKVRSVLEEQEQKQGDNLIEVLVEIHSSCAARHPLQRAINSMFLSLSDEGQKSTVVRLISVNLLRLLEDQLEPNPENLEKKLLPAAQSTVNISTRMQYIESLLENFMLGETGLKLQLPLALEYSAAAICYCSCSCAIDVLTDTLKTTMNMLHKFSERFFSISVESSSWMANEWPKDSRMEWVKKKLLDIGLTCERLMLQDNLPRDAILAAAMLSVVVSNIILSSEDSNDLHNHEELVEYWFAHDQLKPFAKLALCHAFMAKLSTKIMVDVKLGDELLVFALFPIVCNLFNSFTGSSDRYIASRSLALWSGVAKECLLGNPENVLIRNVLTPSGAVVRTLLEYIWSLWEDPIDGIRHKCKDMFENVIVIYKHLGSAKKENLYDLAKLLLSLESPTRGKFNLLSSLAQHLSVSKLVLMFPSLPGDLLSVMGHQALACHAGDLWSKLVHLHWLEVSGKEGPEGVWIEMWVSALLNAMCTSSPLARRHITRHCMPVLFRSNDNCMEYVEQKLEKISSSPDSRMVTKLACLICAKIECKNFFQSLDSFENIFRSSMHHSDEQIRLSALCLICDSIKTVEAPPPSYLALLLEFIEVNGNSQSIGFRESVLTTFKRILNRIKDSSYALLKLCQKGRGPNPVSLIQSYKKFMQDLIDQQFAVLHPLSSFQRRNFSLSILRICASAFPSSPVTSTSEVAVPDTIISPVFVFSEAVSDSQASSLFEGLRDPYNANRIISLDLVLGLPTNKLGLNESSFLRRCVITYLASVNKPKSVGCASAACVLKCLMFHVSTDFNRVLAALLNKDPVAVSHEDHPAIITLNLLSFLLDQHISIAESDLITASMEAPMYGVLQSIHAIFELRFWTDFEVSESLCHIISRLIETCKHLSELVSPVVCSSSPEGFLLEVSSEQNIIALNSSGNAQSLLLCCWHTMKEVSLLFGYFVEHFNVITDLPNKLSVLTENQMEVIANVFIHQLTEARHRGAFEMAYTGFSKLCCALWNSPISELGQKPMLWMKDLLELLKSSSVAQLLNVTRRSAGLPFFSQAILVSEPSSLGKKCLSSTMEILHKVARDVVTNQATVGNQVSSSVDGVPVPPAAVHALNILRALYRDSRLAEHIVPYVPEGVIIAITGFSANLWPVRNSSNLLFTALVLRIFGAKRVQDEHSMENKMTAREFFTRFPTLHSYLVERLQESTERIIKERTVGSLQPSLLPVLILFSKLYPSPLDEDTPISLQPVIPLLLRCTCCSVWKTRILVAYILSLMLTKQNCMSVIERVYDQMTLSDQNGLHGLLLVVRRAIEDKRNLCGRSNSKVLLEFHLCKSWIGLRGNSCAVTKVLYLEILNSLMETSDSLALLSLDTKSSSHLAALTTQSFNVCSNFKPPVDGEAILHENVLLENMKLLRLAPSHPSLFPISARSLDFTQVIVGILKFSQSVLVKVHVLKCIDSCTDEITQVLTGLVLQGADPDVLVEVYHCLFREGMAAKMHHFDKLVSTAYHQLQQSCNRIELKVSLIQFLSNSLCSLQCKATSLQYLGGLLRLFEQLMVPTEPFEIRFAIATDLLKLWHLALYATNSEIARCCNVVVNLLQDTDSEIRERIAEHAALLLKNADCGDWENLNPSSALKFFITSLPQLIPNSDSCFDVLLSLLPENSHKVSTPLNPLFDEDPVNDYAEKLVLIEHLVKSLEIVIDKLVCGENLSPKHRDSLARHVSVKIHRNSDLSLWEEPHVYLDLLKSSLLHPILVTIRSNIESSDSSNVELVRKMHL